MMEYIVLVIAEIITGIPEENRTEIFVSRVHAWTEKRAIEAAAAEVKNQADPCHTVNVKSCNARRLKDIPVIKA